MKNSLLTEREAPATRSNMQQHDLKMYEACGLEKDSHILIVPLTP